MPKVEEEKADEEKKDEEKPVEKTGTAVAFAHLDIQRDSGNIYL